MAVFNEPTKWSQTLGKDADVVKIPDIAEDTDPSIDKIFPSVFSIPLARGGRAIPRSVLNGLFKLLGDWVYYIQNGGIASYSDTFDYAVGSFVKYNNEFYRCIQANGPSSTVKAPGSDESTWTKLINKTSLDSKLATYNAPTASKLQTARSLIITDGLDNSGAGASFDGSKNVTISLPPYIATQLLADKTKCYGNDYYDDSDITSLIYAGNGAGTIRNEIANGNFSRVHPGQTIQGKATGTTYIVVGCNIYKHRGDTELTQNHICLMPIQLVGNAGNLLWSGKTYQGASGNNSRQGYAPWASDNDTEGKNQTSCYKDSYIAKTVLPKVDNLWLKPDFENQGISVLTFRNLDAMKYNANATCMSNPNWKGCAIDWWLDSYTNGWTSKRLVLPSEHEIYGHCAWAGSSFESGSQYTQLPLFRHKEIDKICPEADIWLKDSASASYACNVSAYGHNALSLASRVLRVCPLFLIA
jgi:hypothetical protein